MIKRSYDECHLIDGTQMLVPDVAIEITYDDIEGADRGFDQAGYYHRTVVRFNKRSWKFKYSVLTKEEFVYLRSLVKEKQDFLF